MENGEAAAYFLQAGGDPDSDGTTQAMLNLGKFPEFTGKPQDFLKIQTKFYQISELQGVSA